MVALSSYNIIVYCYFLSLQSFCVSRVIQAWWAEVWATRLWTQSGRASLAPAAETAAMTYCSSDKNRLIHAGDNSSSLTFTKFFVQHTIIQLPCLPWIVYFCVCFFLACITQKQFIFFLHLGQTSHCVCMCGCHPLLFIVSAFVGNLSAVTFLPKFD